MQKAVEILTVLVALLTATSVLAQNPQGSIGPAGFRYDRSITRPSFEASITTVPGQTLLNVLSMGVDNTGATDCSDSVQAAIDTVEAWGGGVLYFPAGTYVVDDLMVDASGVQMIGDGLETIFEFPDGKITTSGADIRARMLKVAADHFSIEDIKFDCNESGQPAWDEQVYGIRVQGASNVRIRNCVFTDIMGDGIILTHALDDRVDYAGVDQVWVENCEFYAEHDNRQGITIDAGTNIWITGNYFYHMTKIGMPAAIDIEPGTAAKVVRNVVIDGNTIVARDRIVGPYGILVTATPGGGPMIRDIAIINNTFTGGLRYSIYVAGYATTDTTSTNVTVSGNILDGVNYGGVGARAYRAGIFAANTGNVLISDNVIRANLSWDDWSARNRGSAISVQDPNGTVRVEGNIVSAADSTLIGILTRTVGSGAGRVDVIDNTLINFQRFGILHAFKGDVRNNRLVDVCQASFTAGACDGIYIQADSSRVTGNSIHGLDNMRYGIAYSSNTKVVNSMWGNIISSATKAETRLYDGTEIMNVEPD